MRNGYIINTLTSVVICEVVKMGAKVSKIYEGGFYRKNFKYHFLQKLLKNCVSGENNIKMNITI